VAVVVLAVLAVAAFAFGEPGLGGFLILLGVVAIPVWAMMTAAKRQHAGLRAAPHEQKQAWREAGEGKVLRTDIPWRSGPSGGGGL
jgi:hypothetical protein